ncbi:MAG TPA: hypothetical protein VIE64_06380 [Solirubrobacterales bacterium]|jgi:hypothetical protein
MPATQVKVGECRQCRSFCDKMIEPRSCVEMGCRYLYSFIDGLTGIQYVGCMQDVFRAKVELNAVLQPGGFGGVKMTGNPLAHCPFEVEQAYDGTGSGYDCVNRRFFDCGDDGSEGLRAFDLRDI